VRILFDGQKFSNIADSVERSLGPVSMTKFLEGPTDEFLRQRASNRFSSQGDDAVGGKWVKLKEVTEQIRISKGFPPRRPINVRTGDFRTWLTRNTKPQTISTPAGHEMSWPGKMDRLQKRKMMVAQGQTNVAARPVAAIDELDAVAIRSSLSLYLSEQWVS